MSKNLSFTGGYIILVEGDKPNGSEWFIAKEWQQQAFMKAMEFGTMKSMGRPHPITKTTPFKCIENGFNYRFIIYNDWEPVYIENMETKKQREIKFIELTLSNNNTSSSSYNSNSKVSKLILG